MAPLRRRTGEILGCLLLACLAASLVGAVLVAFRDPQGALGITVLALLIAVGVTRALGEGVKTFLGIGTVIGVLSLGLYALHLILGLSGDAVLWVAILVGLLVLVILCRSLIAAGSADYPYDDL